MRLKTSCGGARVLRTGGQILITTPRRQGDEPGHEYHCREYTGGELAELLRGGFSDVTVRAFQPAAVARLYEQRVFGRKAFAWLSTALPSPGGTRWLGLPGSMTRHVIRTFARQAANPDA
jgi:hypothetical protein